MKHALTKDIKVNTVCGVSSSGIGLGSAGPEVVPEVVDRAESVGGGSAESARTTQVVLAQ